MWRTSLALFGVRTTGSRISALADDETVSCGGDDLLGDDLGLIHPEDALNLVRNRLAAGSSHRSIGSEWLSRPQREPRREASRQLATNVRSEVSSAALRPTDGTHGRTRFANRTEGSERPSFSIPGMPISTMPMPLSSNDGPDRFKAVHLQSIGFTHY